MEVESNSLVPYAVTRFISAVAHDKGGVLYFEARSADIVAAAVLRPRSTDTPDILVRSRARSVGADSLSGGELGRRRLRQREILSQGAGLFTRMFPGEQDVDGRNDQQGENCA